MGGRLHALNARLPYINQMQPYFSRIHDEPTLKDEGVTFYKTATSLNANET